MIQTVTARVTKMGLKFPKTYFGKYGIVLFLLSLRLQYLLLCCFSN